jgi:hypothetical protein
MQIISSKDGNCTFTSEICISTCYKYMHPVGEQQVPPIYHTTRCHVPKAPVIFILTAVGTSNLTVPV